uniref:Putative Se/S carrier protein-like domain-containing protein n=1 Tax=Loigolactobacillus rennini TaxID=238013 RepID=A0A1K2I5A5_9LACO|nr:hypothetical protein LREN565_0037 [Loigolactobacillus rennini]
MTSEFGLMTFKNTHQAIKTHELLEHYPDYNADIIATPGQISAGCGMSVRFKYGQKAALKKLLAAKEYDYQHIYHGQRSIGVQSSYQVDD